MSLRSVSASKDVIGDLVVDYVVSRHMHTTGLSAVYKYLQCSIFKYVHRRRPSLPRMTRWADHVLCVLEMLTSPIRE